MFRKNCKLYLVIAFSVLFSSQLISQEIPEIKSYPVEGIQTDESLIDSNEVYKKQFDSLSKDGEWIKVEKTELLQELDNLTDEEISYDYPYYSDYVYFWRPFEANTYWNPYMNGGWAFSNYGWVWLSNYSWGWGPYNYGRWYFSNMYGWLWLPGNTWAANWVNWRWDGRHIGWYPSYPYFPGYNRGSVRYQVATNHQYGTLPQNWVFIKVSDFTRKIDNNVIVKASGNENILKGSEVITTSKYSGPDENFTYSGPNVKLISKETGEKITPKEIVVADLRRKQYENENYITTFVNRDSKVSETPVEKVEVRDGNSNVNQTDVKTPTTRSERKKTTTKKKRERSYESGDDYIYKGNDSNSNTGTKNSSNDDTSTKRVERSDGNTNTNSNDGTRTTK